MRFSTDACDLPVDGDAAGLRALLHDCRLTLAAVRFSVTGDRRLAGPDEDAGMERRLLDVADRLEQTARTLERTFELSAGLVSAPGATVIARAADHRIETNLHAVTTLLQLRADHAKAEPVRAALQAAGAQVAAVAQLHACLHAAPGGSVVAQLNLSLYLGSLCDMLRSAMGLDGYWRALCVDVAPLAISPEQATQLGLIVSELVMNALHHAFGPDRPGQIWVSGHRCDDGGYQLCIEDGGCGLPHDFDLDLPRYGVGLRMVRMLARELGARLSADGLGGARFMLTLSAQA